MRRSIRLVTLAGLLVGSAASAQQPLTQYPMAETVAQKVIQKYQTASCQQLWAEKAQPPTAQEAAATQMLRNDPAMRTAFIGRVAPSIVNKMFECGMVP